MITYIWKLAPGSYIDFEEEIDPIYWEGLIGDTLDDFYAGKWVKLSDEQVAFHNENPHATLLEVWNVQITPVPERTVEDAKREKIAQIEKYDFSDAVNSFDIIVNGNAMSAWLTPSKRANYKNSVDAAELIGLEELHPIFNGVELTLSVQMAKMALAQIQLYADRCFIVTEMHKSEVNSLDSIEAIDNYDVTVGYPERLSFTL